MANSNNGTPASSRICVLRYCFGGVAAELVTETLTAGPTDTARYCEALENVTSSKPILESPTANRPGAC